MTWRKIDSRIWSDGWFLGLDDDARMLWLYLLTCQHWAGSLPGLFRCHSGTAAGDLGWDQPRYDAAFAVILNSKRIEFDKRTGLLWIVRAFEYCTEKKDTREMYWQGLMESLPECPLREKAWEKIRGASPVHSRKKSEPLLKDPISHLPSPISANGGAGRLRGDSAETPGSLSASCRPSSDLTPWWPDIAEAMRAAWGMSEAPPMLQGDDLARMLQAYRDGEEKSPGHGVKRIVWAVWGHQKAATAEGEDKRYRVPKYAFPPVLEGGKANWKSLDLSRFHVYAESGKKIEASAERRAKNEEEYRKGLSGHG